MASEFNYLLQSLHHGNGIAQHSVLRKMADTIQYADKMDLQKCLELLNNTGDMELQYKLLIILASYLLTKITNISVIITCKSLYGTLDHLLNSRLPVKTATILNFIRSLLLFENEGTKGLAMYARHMLRLSGCLKTMCYLFTCSTMNQDSWMALCQSLAEACRGLDLNQDFCSLLVVPCLHRCLQGDIVACLPLQSLLHNHQQNMQTFLNYNGLSMFTRQLLQYDATLQVLDTLVQKSSEAVSRLAATDVIKHIHDILALHGQKTKIGKWANIILCHLRLQIKGPLDCLLDVGSNNTNNQLNSNMDATLNRTIQSQIPDADDTKKLYQNIFKELYNFKPQTEFSFTKPVEESVKINSKFTKRNSTIVRNVNNNNNIPRQTNTSNVRHCRPSNIPSQFWGSREFNDNSNQRTSKIGNEINPLLEQTTKICRKSELNNKNEIIISYMCPQSQNTKESHKIRIVQNDSPYYNKPRATRSNSFGSYVHAPSNDLQNNNIRLNQFHPYSTSTPKRRPSTISETSRISFKNRKTNSPNKNKNNSMTLPLNTGTTQKVNNKSMSTKLINAINESCTTIIKGVRNIFKSRTAALSKNDECLNSIKQDSCNYSFTNYMCSKDASLVNRNESTVHIDSFSFKNYEETQCITCDQTSILQEKVNNDEWLKFTIKRLKIGINVYGCDFKKISKNLWPRDRYMTPKVIYQLYRKLIANK